MKREPGSPALRASPDTGPSVPQLHAMEALEADIDQGAADIAAGRVHTFDASLIVDRGKELSATRVRSD